MPARAADPERDIDRERVFVYIHLVALAAGAMSLVIDLALARPVSYALVGFVALVLGLLWGFRRYGNVVVSGNLLAATMAAVLLEGIGMSGGLYSDNLLWLLLVPVTAFLFASRRWGIFWSAGLIGTLVLMYGLERSAAESFRYASLEYSATYYFVSYLGLFAGVLGVILLFVRSNDLTLARLRATTEQLREQEAQTAAQNALLREKEAALRRSNRDLELFAYVASHDLKEPLRMVTTYAQLIERASPATLPDKERGYLRYVTEGGTRMQAMLDDLLSYARVGRERQGEQEVDLNRALLLVTNYLREQLEATGARLDVGLLPVVRGRMTNFVQVFQNLLANALKFSREGVVPEIVIRATPRAGGGIDISVRDNGIGIRHKDQARIFGVFQRLHERERFEGSGIGLATVKRILEGLGGEITVESHPQQGSTFTIGLPAARVVATAPTQRS